MYHLGGFPRRTSILSVTLQIKETHMHTKWYGSVATLKIGAQIKCSNRSMACAMTPVLAPFATSLWDGLAAYNERVGYGGMAI